MAWRHAAKTGVWYNTEQLSLVRIHPQKGVM